MITLLIVDDELSICDLVRNLIDWDKYRFDLQLIGYAHDGGSALEIIQDRKPDIVITDLRMPEISGISLIEKSSSLSPMTRFVILSGYSDFEAAKAALKWKVEEYLIKPIDQKELNWLLGRVINAIKEEREENVQIKNMNYQLNSRTQALRVLEMKRLLRGDMPEDLSLFQFRGRRFSILLIKLDIEKDCFSRELMENATGILEKVVRQMIEANQLSEVFYDHEVVFFYSKCYCLINYDANEEKKISKLTNSLKAFMQLSIQKYPGYHFSASISTPQNRIEDIAIGAQEADTAIDMRLIGETESVFDYAVYGGCNFNFMSLPQWLQDDIVRGTIALDTAQMLNSVRKYLFELTADHKESYKLYRAAKSILFLFVDTIETSVLVEPVDFMYSKEQVSHTINLFCNIQGLKGFVNDFIKRIIDKCLEHKQLQYSKPVRSAKQYVDEHPQEDISLELIAEYVKMSPNYFSKLFKEKTGVSFPNYVLSCKIEKAKELLKDSYLSIREIAEQVGYSDVKYFSRLFMKNVGIKPSEYRKFYS